METESAPKEPNAPALDVPKVAVFRTPLLAADEFVAWARACDGTESSQNDHAAKVTRAEAWLRSWVERPEIRDAIFVASPSLHDAIELWLTAPASRRGKEAVPALVRYMARMMTRPTPFGLFSTCSVATVGEATRLVLAPRERLERHTRLDNDYLSALTVALSSDRAARMELVYRPNTSLFSDGVQLRMVEARIQGGGRSHHAVAVDDSPFITAALERAKNGASLEAVAHVVKEADSDGEITLEEALEFVHQMCDEQLLVSSFEPPVTGVEPIHALLRDLSECRALSQHAKVLAEARDAIAAIDAGGIGAAPAKYFDIAKGLEALPAKFALSRLYQVDAIRTTEEATLGPKVADAVVRAVTLARRLSSGSSDPMKAFREAFEARYATRMVPLLEVLDEELGIGAELLGSRSTEHTPLLDGLAFPGAVDDGGGKFSNRDGFLLRKLEDVIRSGATELCLEGKERDAFLSREPAQFPDALSLFGTLVASSAEAVDRGEFRLVLHSVIGPSGAKFLGRFCPTDRRIEEITRDHLRVEEARRPDAVFAEIVHMPEGRMGNILCRPVLREYEIPYLGRSGAAEDKQILPSDLFVRVEGKRVVLWSKRLGREVLPRLSTAHNYSQLKTLGVYRFLCLLQGQDAAVPGYSWNWGSLAGLSFLPRVVIDNVVLALARWNVRREEIEKLVAAEGDAQLLAVGAWRNERRMPRFVKLADGDNELTVDLENPLLVESLLHLAKNRPSLVLEELYPSFEELVVEGKDGRYVHELVFPLTFAAPDAKREREPELPLETSRATRYSAPGSEWTYFKLYTGKALMDRLLATALAPVIRGIMEERLADQWFFIRYGDPGWHLRLRFKTANARHRGEILERVSKAVDAMEPVGAVWKTQLDTYDRELERYGGPVGLLLAEELFHVDSDAVLDIVALLDFDAGAIARWQLALRGCDMLLDALGWDFVQKQALITSTRDSFAREFNADQTSLKHQLGSRYRVHAKTIEALLDPSHDDASELAPALAVLAKRSERLAPIVARLRQEERQGNLTRTVSTLTSSYLHMFMNRLTRTAGRKQELVAYDYLRRRYESLAARQRKQPKGSKEKKEKAG